jgi:hypothetical protein
LKRRAGRLTLKAALRYIMAHNSELIMLDWCIIFNYHHTGLGKWEWM